MMVSKRNLLFQGLIFRFHIKLQGYIQTSFQIYTRWPGEKRRSLRGIGSHEDDHAVEGGGLRGASFPRYGNPQKFPRLPRNFKSYTVLVGWVGVWGKGFYVPKFSGLQLLENFLD